MRRIFYINLTYNHTSRVFPGTETCQGVTRGQGHRGGRGEMVVRPSAVNYQTLLSAWFPDKKNSQPIHEAYLG